ncbi:erythromycin esterase family protein [Natrinema zhouii]|uniref:erythromycin esterase family protein n=1 Tax=Natrinema zhouii TaxID=1710539 RepID=UPI001CFFFB6E|nr:erythromycin esterase family protein [Natrinema zhouii]QLK27896.2 erythromycin esterase family protein [Natrinema zhouii]
MRTRTPAGTADVCKDQSETGSSATLEWVSHVTAQRFETADADPERVADTVAERATAVDDGFDGLADGIADADVVLLGEASHGTSEYYRLRARLTVRLLEERDFSFVAVEGDWTDCYEVTEYVTGRTEADDASAVLADFDRWPTWMWANWEVAEFLDWLAEYNADRPVSERAGFYGLDVYSLYESMAAVIDYLQDRDPELADRARDAYHCFEPYGEDAREYASSIRLVPEDCEEEVLEVLRELREEVSERHAGRVDDRSESVDADDPLADFAAEQNALVAKNAESYYRAMARGGRESWNVRDRHMSETLERLLEFHDGPGIVWAHNTHVGDARATTMRDRGKLNLGQLAREEVCDDDSDVAAVGFGSHRGTVVAGDEWGARMERMTVPEAKAGSYEDVFHRAGLEDGILEFDRGYGVADDADDDPLADPRGHRAIGVVYNPDYEGGNYVRTVLPDRYDAFVHVDETEALYPFDIEGGETPPETYPWGV